MDLYDPEKDLRHVLLRVESTSSQNPRRAAAGRKPSGRRAEPPPPEVLIMPFFRSGFRIKKPIGRPF